MTDIQHHLTLRRLRAVRQRLPRPGVTFVDNWSDTELAELRYWSRDQLHLNALGHARVAGNVLAALEGRSACLMANHGMVVTGSSLPKAMWAAVELETIAKQYYHSLLIGGPVILPDEEIVDVAKAFGTYGHQG